MKIPGVNHRSQSGLERLFPMLLPATMSLMSSSSPRVTVVIPAYNEEDTIAEVVRAVKVLECDIVVVSDGSEDATVERAREAGATVIDQQLNAGKGEAIFAGVSAAKTEFVLLLDADLVGLTHNHFDRLLKPVLEGEQDMTIGIFNSGKALTDFGNRVTPHLSGQRACRRDWLLEVPRLREERWPEPAIKDHLKSSGARWTFVDLPGLSQVMKEKKRGFWEGFKYRSKMYADLLGYKMRRDG